jgi:hypothetical protein
MNMSGEGNKHKEQLLEKIKECRGIENKDEEKRK